MRNFSIFLFPLLLCACNIKLKTEDAKVNAEVTGESYSYIVVRLEFISQLIELCADLVLDSDYPTQELADQARAQCVFDKIEDINVTLPQFTEDVNALCNAPTDGLTPEQLADLEAVCTNL